MSLTCPQHRGKGPDGRHRPRGSEEAHQGDLGHHDGAEDVDYADHDMPNGDAVRPRNLDRSGVQALQRTTCNRLPVVCSASAFYPFSVNSFFLHFLSLATA